MSEGRGTPHASLPWQRGSISPRRSVPNWRERGQSMAEESESGEASAGVAVDTTAATWGILTAASRDKADTFLTEQTRLTKLQHRVLHHEELLRLWLLRAQHMSALLKVAFEIAVALIVLAVLGFAIMEIWDALHDSGLAIEAFQVPSD